MGLESKGGARECIATFWPYLSRVGLVCCLGCFWGSKRAKEGASFSVHDSWALGDTRQAKICKGCV